MLGPFKGKRGSILAATAGLCLLAITPAGATGPSTAIGRLQSDDASLASKSRAAVLQLYSLDARLSTAQSRLAALRDVRRKLEQQRGWLLHEQTIAKLDTRLSQDQLASRLRFIYDHGATSSLDILMGAQSIGDAITQLDDVNKVTASNTDVLVQVQSSRRHLAALSRNLAARRLSIESATTEAAATVSQLEALRASRAAYVDDLAQRRSLDARRIATLQAQAQTASARAQTLTANATSRQQTAAVVSSPLSTPDLTAAQLLPAAQLPATQGPVSQLPGTRTLTVVATGYDLSGRTSTGLPVGWGIAAVDPSVIPLGTRIVIPGYGEAIAADTGGSIVGSTIDLWFPTASQAVAWGRRTITISLA